MTQKKTDEQLLAEADALCAAYAAADAADAIANARHGATQTIYRIAWDNGAGACGVIQGCSFDTEEAAQAIADDIEADNRASGVWDDEGSCEVIAVQVPADREADQDAANETRELRRAALNHRGEP